MKKSKTRTNKCRTTGSAERASRVRVGEAFTADDLQFANDPKDVEPRMKAKATTILLAALIAFYSVYMAHEWLSGNSFGTIGRFLETGLGMFLGWCLGRNFSDRKKVKPG
jgi:peptidoglycan/LPS O-acetylase OafA/YrhL